MDEMYDQKVTSYTYYTDNKKSSKKRLKKDDKKYKYKINKKWQLKNKDRLPIYRKTYREKITWSKRLFTYCKGKNKHIYNNPNIDFDDKYIEFLFEKQKGKCYWFNISLDINSRNRNPLKPSIDRLDNTKGYMKDNIVLCSMVSNLGRSTTEVTEWIEIINMIKTAELFNNKSI